MNLPSPIFKNARALLAPSLALACALAACPTQAAVVSQPNFMGASLGATFDATPTLTPPASSTAFVVTSAAADYSLGNGAYSFDFGATSIAFSSNANGSTVPGGPAFLGFRFFDLSDNLDEIVAVTINPAGNAMGLSADRVSFNANGIAINLVGMPLKAFQLDLRFASSAATSDGSDVPEPASLALVAGALLAAAAARRRSKA